MSDFACGNFYPTARQSDWPKVLNKKNTGTPCLMRNGNQQHDELFVSIVGQTSRSVWTLFCENMTFFHRTAEGVHKKKEFLTGYSKTYLDGYDAHSSV